jgi:hypothetical protein
VIFQSTGGHKSSKDCSEATCPLSPATSMLHSCVTLFIREEIGLRAAQHDSGSAPAQSLPIRPLLPSVPFGLGPDLSSTTLAPGHCVTAPHCLALSFSSLSFWSPLPCPVVVPPVLSSLWLVFGRTCVVCVHPADCLLFLTLHVWNAVGVPLHILPVPSPDPFCWDHTLLCALPCGSLAEGTLGRSCWSPCPLSAGHPPGGLPVSPHQPSKGSPLPTPLGAHLARGLV